MLNPYTKTVYINDQAPPLDQTNLNNSEEGIEAVTNEAITLDSRVTDLEAHVPFEPLYQYSKQTDLTMTDVYTTIDELHATDLPIGTYEITYSLQWGFDSTSTSAFMRYSVDGGTTWVEAEQEPKDSSDKRLMMYGFPTVISSGEIHLIFQMRKETSAGILYVYYNNIMLERKL